MKHKCRKIILSIVGGMTVLLVVGGAFFSYQVGKSVGEGCLSIEREEDTTIA